MNTQHTPGPWRVSHGATIFPSIGSLCTHTKICDFPTDMGRDVEANAEVKANAHLIASAPELLEVCDLFLHWCNIKDGSPDQYLRDMAINVIKKANGLIG